MIKEQLIIIDNLILYSNIFFQVVCFQLKKNLEDINYKVGLEFKEIKSFGLSYAKTLNLWNQQFQNSWEELVQLGFNVRFKRMWEYYLSYCETGFLSKSTDVSHFLINK